MSKQTGKQACLSCLSRLQMFPEAVEVWDHNCYWGGCKNGTCNPPPKKQSPVGSWVCGGVAGGVCVWGWGVHVCTHAQNDSWNFYLKNNCRGRGYNSKDSWILTMYGGWQTVVNYGIGPLFECLTLATVADQGDFGLRGKKTAHQPQCPTGRMKWACRIHLFAFLLRREGKPHQCRILDEGVKFTKGKIMSCGLKKRRERIPKWHL